jgi:NADH dehydrogenase
MRNKTIYLTGASGFLGSDLAFFFRERGNEVIPMARNIGESENIYFDMSSSNRMPAPPKPGALVHCAWLMDALSPKYVETNVGGSITLLRWALENKLNPIIFISTTSVFPGCKSMYCRAKYEVELFCKDNGILIVRPGLVCSRRQIGGMVGKLAQIVKTLPLVPLIDGGRQVFYISDTEDFSLALLTLIDDPSIYRPNEPVLAADQPITFRDILEMLGQAVGRRSRFISLPGFLIRVPLRAAAKVGLNLPVNEDNLEGLLSVPPIQPVNTKLATMFKHTLEGAMLSKS